MSKAELLIMLATLVNLLGLWVYWFICRRLHRLDALRQKLFALRDDAFIYCAESGIPFDHPAYTLLRSASNAMIRYTRRLNYATLITLAIYRDREGAARIEKAITESVESLPTVEQRERVLAFYERMHLIIGDYIIHNSILSILLVYGATVLALVASIVIKGARGKNAKSEVGKRASPLVEADAVERDNLGLAAA